MDKDEKMQSLQELFVKRSSIKGQITKFKNYLTNLTSKTTITNTEIAELVLRLSRFESLSLKFDDLQNQIEVLNSRNLQEEIDERDNIEQSFISSISSAKGIIQKHQSNKTHVSSDPIVTNNLIAGFKLPRLEIAKFNGTYFRWLEFRDTFKSVIHDNGHIAPINKFHYLLSYLEGEASRIVSNLEVSDSNYNIAWKLLCDRYDNKRQLISHHFNSLLNINNMTRESDKSLRYMVDHVTKNLRALSGLGLQTDNWDPLLIHILSSKLDNRTLTKWEEWRGSMEDVVPNLQQFNKFLTDRADVLVSLNNSSNSNNSNKASGSTPFKNNNNKSDRPHNKSFTCNSACQNNSSTASCCVVCQGQHRIYDCPIFKAKSVEERIAEVHKLNLCANCLRSGHITRNCYLRPCRECKKKHNALLHIPLVTETPDETTTNSCGTIANCTTQGSKYILLSTAMVEVSNPTTNKTERARALLDCGSQSSFMTQSLKDKLCLSGKSLNNDYINIVGIGNQVHSKVKESCVAQLNSLIKPFHITTSFLILPELTSKIPTYTLNTQQLKIPPEVHLADPNFNQSSDVDLLIGADLFWDILGCHQQSLGPNNPTLRSSEFGWIVSGPIELNNLNNIVNIQCHHSLSSSDIVEKDFNQQISRFWDLEEIPLKSTLSHEERLCEKHFITHTERLTNGRFSVRLPLKDSPNCLGESYTQAKKRFHLLEKRFRKHPQLKLEYVKFIKEYEQLGHLSQSDILRPDLSYFLCHHAVFKENSESTKIRVVFDGSAATSSGLSINDILMVGQNLQDSLFSILVRARQHKYLLTGDVEKMYRMVELNDKDRNLQLILWRDDESLPIKTMKLNTVTYGMASSSYLSTRCLWQLGEDYPDVIIKNVIQHDFYVDDMITSSDSEQELKHILNGVTAALRLGCFNLRKLKSNLKTLFDSSSINTDDKLTLSESSSTLGLGWDPSTDTLHFPIHSSLLSKNNNPTKRSILSNLFKIFDPLGLLSSCVVQTKIILQQLWLEKLGWDDNIPEEISKAWDKFSESLSALMAIKVPRHVLCDEPTSIELHSFCDASQSAYGACVYARSINSGNIVTVRLLCAKSKIAPTKPTTIPRLELCAALLASRLCKAVRDALRNIQINSEVHWCDSSIVLAWLHTSFKNLKTFVANRISEICELTDVNSWRHVPTSLNPADLISRGVSPNQIGDNMLWWSGPQYLLQAEDSWPVLSKIDTKEINNLPEIKQNFTTINSEPLKENLINFEKYQDYVHLQRSFAYVIRYITNLKLKSCKQPLVKGILKLSELNNFHITLCRLAQQQSYPQEYKTLVAGKQLNLKSKLLSLSPFYCPKDKVIRVGGRIDSSNYPYDKKHPVLLDASHHLTKLIFRREHLRNLHAGPQLLLGVIRDYVWPINGRRLARQTVRSCFKCRRFQAKSLEPMMGNLPSQRVTPTFPFTTVGIDFAGPFFMLNRKGRGAKLIKGYLCLFVCLTYKCLHLEAVTDLSKDAFIMTFRRFVARRGRPTEVFCDNGRNFVAGAKELNNFLNMNADALSDFASGEGIKFVFSPSYAPHFGGIWEAGVKSAKYHLKRVMGNSHLTFEELSTLFAQVESILNSRPLYPMSSTPDDLLCLTPGHFLIGRALTAIPSPSLEDHNIDNLRRYQRIQHLHQHFWRRWQREYIAELQQRCKWKVDNTSLNIGDLVLLKEDNSPPLCWRLGRVTRLFPGSDGISRVADVKTQRGVVRRPLVRLCPLPSADKLDM